jgi:sensor domain CHASE-containing protein
MSLPAALLIALGAPLILIALSLVILAVKIFRDGGKRQERAQTVETARRLELALSGLENRLSALEDIILAASNRKGADHD